jgi:hypothetical protein
LNANGLFIRRTTDNSAIGICAGPLENVAPYILLYGKSNPNTNAQGIFVINLINDNGDIATLTGRPTGELTWHGTDIAGSAIVAKSLGTNGYIKYASGLTCAWYTSGGSQPITIPTKVWEGKDSANRTFIIGY